jgi:hypothetical protein
LARTIRSKLETVRSTVGLERPVLEPGEDFEAVATALRDGHTDILDRLDAAPESRLSQVWNATGPPPGLPGIPIAALPGASGSRILVGVRRGNEWEVEVVCVATGRVVDSSRTEAILLDALSERNVYPVVAAAVQRAALAHLAAINRRSETAAQRNRSPSALLARRLRSLMAGLPLESTAPAFFARADALLIRLGSGEGLAEEDVEGILTDKTVELDVLLTRLEAAVSRDKIAARESDPWTLTGVIVAD